MGRDFGRRNGINNRRTKLHMVGFCYIKLTGSMVGGRETEQPNGCGLGDETGLDRNQEAGRKAT